MLVLNVQLNSKVIKLHNSVRTQSAVQSPHKLTLKVPKNPNEGNRITELVQLVQPHEATEMARILSLRAITPDIDEERRQSS
jgi:hypothetical protein